MDRYAAREIVLKSTTLSKGARMLYMVLDNYQRNGSECWPGQRTLREIVDCSPRSLCRYLDELVKAGLCARRRRYGQSNSFVLHWCHQRHDHGATDGTMNMPPAARHKANQALNPEIQGASAENPKPASVIDYLQQTRENRAPKSECSVCEGRGFVRAVKRGILVAERCECVRERRSA
jgi:hypothetical protein